MNKPLLIGITGGIGGGKSTLADKLRNEGYEVYNSDLEARRLQNEHPVIREKLIELFGETIYNVDGLNRRELAKLVFGKKDLLSQLNAIVHPVVRKDFEHWINVHGSQKLLFIESAILFESGFSALVDKIILMTACEEIRIKRVMKRDGISEEEVKARIASQSTEESKMLKSDFIVHSDDNMPLLDKMYRILDALMDGLE